MNTHHRSNILPARNARVRSFIFIAVFLVEGILFVLVPRLPSPSFSRCRKNQSSDFIFARQASTSPPLPVAAGIFLFVWHSFLVKLVVVLLLGVSERKQVIHGRVHSSWWSSKPHYTLECGYFPSLISATPQTCQA